MEVELVCLLLIFSGVAGAGLRCQSCTNIKGTQGDCTDFGSVIDDTDPSCNFPYSCFTSVTCDGEDLTWNKGCISRSAVGVHDQRECNPSADVCEFFCETDLCNERNEDAIWREHPCVDDQNLVEALLEDKQISFNANDITNFVETYAMDGIVYPHGDRPQRGRAAIEARFSGLGADKGLKGERIKRDYFAINDEFALEAICFTRFNDDGSFKSYGRSYYILRKNSQTQDFEIVRHMFQPGEPSGRC